MAAMYRKVVTKFKIFGRFMKKKPKFILVKITPTELDQLDQSNFLVKFFS